MRRAPAHGARRHALLLAARRSDGDDLLARPPAPAPARTRAARAARTPRPSDRSTGSPRHARRRCRRQLAATLTVGDSCTSIAVALPTTRWLVAISPLAPMDEAGSVRRRRPDRRRRCPATWPAASPIRCRPTTWPASRRLPDSTSAFSAVSSSTASRPATTSSVCDPRVEPCPGTRRADPIRSCSCPAAGGRSAVPSSAVMTRRGGAAGRILADEQQIARHRRRLAVGVLHHDLDVEDARRLDGRCRRERPSGALPEPVRAA